VQIPRLRPRREGPAPVLAAATRVRLEQPKLARKQGGRRQPWQDEAWTFFDTVPEVKQGTWRMGNQIAKVRLVVATMPADGTEPILASDPASSVSPDLARLAELELARLRSSLGGQPEIMRELSMNLDVAGECFIVGWGAITPAVGPLGQISEGRDEDWDVRSISEVEVKGSGDTAQYVVKDSPDDKGTPLDPETDTIIRVWQRHPRWSALADCAMAGVRGECEALVTLHAEVLADSRSRHNAGLLTIPNELSFGAPPDDGEDTGEDADADPLTDEITDVFSDPIDNPADPGAVAPSLLRGPAQYLTPDHVRWVDLGRKPSEQLDNRIKARVERLARGLNWPVESTMGHQQTTFANAEQVDEDEFSDYHQPRLETICDALSTAYLRANLVDAGADPVQCERLFVWYDATALVRDPDKSQDALAVHGVNALSDAALRKYTGFSEDDAPMPLELLQRTGLKRGIFTSDLSLALLDLLGIAIDVEPIPKAPTLPAEGVAPDEPAEGEEEEDPADATARMLRTLERHPRFAAQLAARRLRAIDTTGTVTAAAARPRRANDLGRRLMNIDMDLRTRLLVLADRTLDRALERAGNKLRSQTSFRPLLRGVDSRLAGVHLGRALVADAGMSPADLLADAMVPMREQFMAWGAGSQEQAIELVSRAVGGFELAQREALQLRQADSLEEAWQWLEKALTAHAERMLFDPSATAVEAVGELASSVNVPPGMIREAVSIIGGHGAVSTTGGGDAWVALSSDQYMGGIGTGDLVNEVLAQMGFGTEAYEWVVGAPSRPFEPHQELDGVTFEDWSDPVLANGGSFPAGGYYIPGDHAGCQCDVAPVIVGPDGSTEIDLGPLA
jgi:hypothetical protein